MCGCLHVYLCLHHLTREPDVSAVGSNMHDLHVANAAGFELS